MSRGDNPEPGAESRDEPSFVDLLTRVSATLVSVSDAQVLEGIASALAQIGEFLRMDRVSFCELGREAPGFHVMAQWVAAEVPRTTGLIPADSLPWSVARVQEGEIVRVSDLQELPPEAATDRQTFESLGTRSHLSIPLRVGGRVVGSLALGSVRRRRRWSEAAVEQLHPVADLIAGALARDKGYQELLKSEMRYRSFVHNSSEGIWCMEFDGPVPLDLPEEEAMVRLYQEARIVEANEAFARLYGFRNVEEMGVWRLADFIPGDLPQTDALLRAGVRARYALQGVESTEVDRLGNPKIFLNNFSPEIADGKLVRLWGTSRDVTALRAAEEHKRLLAAAVEAQSAGCLIVDARADDMPIVYLNRGFTELTGYEPAEVLGTNCRFLQGSGTDRHTTAAIRRALARGDAFEGEILNYRRDGTPFWNRLRIHPVFGEGGSLTHFVGSQTDVTERRQRDDELRALREQLAHMGRVTTMGELAAAVAHELNQPLAAILSNAQAAQRLLNRDPPDVDEVRDALADIVEDDRRAGEVIRRLRDLMKRGEPHQEAVDMNGLLHGLLPIVESEAMGRNVHLRIDLATDLAPVLGDPVQLQQVLINLFMNALEATSTLQGTEGQEVALCTRNLRDRVRVAVRDTGPGLPPKATERVFDAFYTTKPGGLGMGLAICRSIVEAHGGRLQAVPRPDRGVTFQFTLPAWRQERVS